MEPRRHQTGLSDCGRGGGAPQAMARGQPAMAAPRSARPEGPGRGMSIRQRRVIHGREVALLAADPARSAPPRGPEGVPNTAATGPELGRRGTP